MEQVVEKEMVAEVVELAKRELNDTATGAVEARIKEILADPHWGAFMKRMVKAARGIRREKTRWQRKRMRQMPRLIEQRREVVERYYRNRRREEWAKRKPALRVLKGGR